ncbi:hypothetical protein DSL72_003474 [Monilinia vaccinii-corymbosi]|uniref:Uncharacterized protein n=1 Tax=Monilinia vaccinii-corymbosi TaxID=61207 RepID=A0A8A3P916_9HELO|nr:hypothetical protein DSL72_003474 [Monilinia vaccinii-corymbosi]
MADTQSQSSASDVAVSAGEEPEHLHGPWVSCMCARCVQRVVIVPWELCLLPEVPPDVPGADTVCTYCRGQRGCCWKSPAALRPQILKLQQRAAEFCQWHWANEALPPALRSSWVLPARPRAVYTDLPSSDPLAAATNWPAHTPQVYKDLHAAQRVVSVGVHRAERAIPGWEQMSAIQRNVRLRLDPVARSEDRAHDGY